MCEIKYFHAGMQFFNGLHSVLVVLVYQAAQQVMELQEAAQINQGLQSANVGRDTSVHDMKAIVKTWRYNVILVTS